MSSESPEPPPAAPRRRATSPARATSPTRTTSPTGDDRPVIPDQTSDDTDLGGGDWREAERDDDERYLRERPPHW